MEWGFNIVKVKDTSKKMYSLCLKRAASIGHADFVRTNGQVNLEKIFKTDMLNFLVYLAYADGTIAKEEVKYINLLFGLQFTEKMISDYANRWDLKSENIKNNAPLSLEPFVRSNVGPETGELSSQYYDLIMMYVTTFNYIGNDFIACNKEVLDGEVLALTSYISMLKENIEIIKDKIEDYKPTIAFKPGSKVKREEAPAYTKVNTDDNAWDTIEESTGNSDSRTYMYSDFSLKANREYGRIGSDENKSDSKVNKDEKYSAQDDKKQEIRKENLAVDKDVKHIMNPAEIDLESLMSELNALTGMESVKREINNLVNLLKICKIRQEKGLQLPPTTNHMVFLGNPGTGKTTVARILAKIYRGLGVLSKGHLVEVDRSGLVASYMGQTGEKVMEVVEKAKGGILFIDEAYALSSNKQEGDFGQEAIDILNKAMEDYRDDLIVIAAGYHDEMQDFLDANPGLRSRFNRTIEFPNYTADELVEIMCNRAKKLDYRLSEDALSFVKAKFAKVLAFPPENFGNARSVRNYLDNVINNQANRLVVEANFNEDELTLLTLADVTTVDLT